METELQKRRKAAKAARETAKAAATNGHAAPAAEANRVRVAERAFLDDGYTRTVGFRRVPGVSPEMVFTYRPFIGPESGAALRRIGAAEGEAKETVESEIIMDRLDGWEYDETPTAEQIRKLNGTNYSRLYGVIMGHAAPDFEILPDGKQVEGTADENAMGADAGNLQTG